LRPVEHGMVKYESLLDGTISIADIAIMNDHLETVAYNKWLASS